MSNTFGIGLVGTSKNNLIEENRLGGNLNGILIGSSTQGGNVIRRNVVAGNPSVQVSTTFGASVGADIQDLSPSGANTFEDNLCVTYSGAGPTPCPKVLRPLATQPPVFTASGIVNAASSVRGALASNTIASIYGTNLATIFATAQLTGGRVPTTLGGVRVTVGGISAPLLFVSPAQINFLVPSGLASGSANVIVTVDAFSGGPAQVTIALASPGIFLFPRTTSAAAVHADGSAVGRFSGATPAMRGEAIVVFGTGFGATSPAVTAGDLFPAQAALTQTAQVTLGGRALTPDFIGGARGAAGVYEIDFKVPADMPSGDHDLVVTIAGAASATGVKVAVQ